jgi:ABC-type uncharacterized transport system involved in gliding motility auxiliary subunit
MNRTLRAITAVVFVGIITFCAISICQKIGSRLRLDITDQGLYTLSDGTKATLAKLNKPLKLKLFYTKTAARKAPDQIRFYNNYYHFVESLLSEYSRASRGMVKLEVIDPRPFSTEEEEAMRYGLRRFPITEEENFFFGLVIQTEFGVVKSVPFFSPDRQNFLEYDISHLIDTAITPEKKRIGVLSSLPVMGEDVSGYMAQLMRMQNRMPQPPWTIVQHLRQKYEVAKVENDAEDINDIDILLVIHPKDLPEKTLFAIDQFVLQGGRAIVCVDPRCIVDNTKDPMGRQTGEPTSQLNKLLGTWGVEMPADTFAGDRSLAMLARIGANDRLEKLIGYLSLTRDCFNKDNVITTELNQIRAVFAGVLRKSAETTGNEIIPLLATTERGNTWQVEGPWDWVRIVPKKFMGYFQDGTEPVVLSYLIKGRFKSSFPDGIEVSGDSSDDESDESKDEGTDSEQKKEAAERRTGLAEASTDCAVIVIADVDFISDQFAYQNSVFGIRVAVGNNSDLFFNAIDDLSGSGDLIGIRSRGNFQRPFVKVNQIRDAAAQETADEEAKINAEIAGFQEELKQIISSAREQDKDLVTRSIVQKRQGLEVKILQARRRLRDVQKGRVERIEQLGTRLQNLNMWSAPAVILLIAIALSVRRSIRRRRYVSHASDA